MARKLPGAEEGGPVDIIDQVLERPILEHMHAGLAGGDRRMRLEIGRIGMGARIRERQQRAFALVGALVADRLIFVRSRLNETVALRVRRSEEHTSELQSLMRISYAVFCL